MKRFLFAWMVCCLALCAQKQTNEARTAALMEQLKADPLRLRQFLHEMPKGGDLHNHLSGAVYAESYLQWAADEGDCIDTTALSIVKPEKPDACAAGQVTAKSALTNPKLYGDLLGAMSMYQWSPEKWHDTGHDHFFATFPRFGAVSRGKWEQMEGELMARAHDQHLLYAELIVGLDRGLSQSLAKNLDFKNGDSLVSTGEMDKALAMIAQGVSTDMPTIRKWVNGFGTEVALDCARDCEPITFRYIFEVYRAAPEEQVFAQMALGFAVADADARVVAINLVQPEDWYASRAEYTDEMIMLDYFHQKYPKVHITLHAGELAPGIVPNADLGYHIESAIEQGHAERIGHGTDIMYERDPDGLLSKMARQHIPVEVNLTSNRVILGVSGKMHPLRQYLRAGVPVVICTDDEGVARSDMTNELIQAVLDQGMTYRELKDAERNSIRYSFADAATKERLSKKLEENFSRFEQEHGRTQAKPARTH